MNLQFTTQISPLVYIFIRVLLVPVEKKGNSECHKARCWQCHMARSAGAVIWYDGRSTSVHGLTDRWVNTVGISIQWNSSPINRGRTANSGCTMGDTTSLLLSGERSQTQKTTYSVIPFMNECPKRQIHRTERRSVVTKGWDVGGMGVSAEPWGFFVGWRKCYKIDCGRQSRVNLSTYSWPLNSLRDWAPTFRVLKNLPGTLQSVPFSRLHIRKFQPTLGHAVVFLHINRPEQFKPMMFKGQLY